MFVNVFVLAKLDNLNRHVEYWDAVDDPTELLKVLALAEAHARAERVASDMDCDCSFHRRVVVLPLYRHSERSRNAFF